MTLWTRLRSVARTQLGLELDEASVKPLETSFASQGFDVQAREAFVRTLESQGPESEAFHTLVRNVTNGQTSFMRDPAQLASIEAFIKLHPASTSRALHVWCAGCSTGEEAYTLSMLGRRALVPLRILATDVNLDALDRAREGVYGEWSLRHVEATERVAHFTSMRKGFRVNDPIRAQVTFRQHNLALEPACTPSASHERWDLVLCRNVLIYFAAEARARVIASFESVLSADGALVLSAAESVRGMGTRLRPRYLGGGYVLSPTQPRASLLPAATATDPARPKRELSRSDAPPSHAPRPSASPRSRALSAAKYWMDLGNDWLKQHEFDQALDAYMQANRLDGVSFEPYLLMALVRVKRSELDEAKAALRSALFLEPRAWSAEYLLAGVHAREGRAAEAQKAFDRALALLETSHAVLVYDSECAGIEPLCYTYDEALAACRKRRGTLREKVRR